MAYDLEEVGVDDVVRSRRIPRDLGKQQNAVVDRRAAVLKRGRGVDAERGVYFAETLGGGRAEVEAVAASCQAGSGIPRIAAVDVCEVKSENRFAQVGFGKPDARIFEHAIAALGVAAGAIALETIADEQLRAFNRSKAPGDICTRGVWAWLRHPNYLGEIGFWWGLWLFGLAAAPGWWWTVIGPLAITVMFVLASIPMLDRRSLARRPGYADVMKNVSALVPRRPRR